MDASEIKEKRKKLGFTQKKLAELIGVSTQTINGYENGKEIPVTKHQILDKILNPSDIHILQEPTAIYTAKTGFELKIAQIEEEISERLEIVDLLELEKKDTSHQLKIIELLKQKINIINDAKNNFINDL